jgi:hypothetical protein
MRFSSEQCNHNIPGQSAFCFAGRHFGRGDITAKKGG